MPIIRHLGRWASDDPDFERKAAHIIGLYLNPPRHAAIFCLDEKSHIQALDRLDPVLPLSPGRAERHGFEYYRHGTLSLYAALDTRSGTVQLRWSRDGNELYFQSGSRIMSVRVMMATQVSVGGPQQVLDLPGLVSYDVMPDGRFVTVRRVGETPEDQIVVIPDWRRLLPTQ